MSLMDVARRVQGALTGDTAYRAHSAALAAAQPCGVTIRCLEKKANSVWARSGRGSVVTVVRKPLITRDSKVFAIGSCFALNIRRVLREKGFAVLPRYFDIEFDQKHQCIGKLPRRDDVNHYTTFSIRQEFEQVFGEAESAGPSDFWKIDSAALRAEIGLDGEELYQNPYRKGTFSDSLAGLVDATRKVDHCIQVAILSADIYIITLGLIELWRDKKSGRYLCGTPELPKMKDADFVLSDFNTNLENMRRVCSLIGERRPGKQIIVTVSPVALKRTFTRQDVVVANMESKSLLRAVAGQLEREFDNVTYWPSYEIAMREDLFKEDGRHVTSQGVERILDAFIEAHCEKQA